MDFQTKQALRARRFQIADLFILVLAISTAAHLPAQDGVAQAKRPYTISKETTYFTGPLKPDGTIDFIAAVNKHFSQGVTPENNAARIIVPLLDPRYFDDAEHRNKVLIALDLDPAKHGDASAFFSRPTLGRAPLPSAAQFETEHALALDRLWNSTEFPLLAKWLDKSVGSMNEIARATKLPRYFSPLEKTKNAQLLLVIWSSDIQAFRHLAKDFFVRANNRMAHQRWEEGWQDILAIWNLGRLGSQGFSAVSCLCGYAVTGISCEAARMFISADNDDVNWRSCFESWNPEANDNLTDVIAVNERVAWNEAICHFFDSPKSAVSFLEPLAVGSELRRTGQFKFEGGPIEAVQAGLIDFFGWNLTQLIKGGFIDLDEALRRNNQAYDELGQILEIENPQRRKTALENVAKNGFGDEQGWPVIAEIVLSSPENRSGRFAQAIIKSVDPAGLAMNMYRSQQRSLASQQVIKFALAARVMQKETGKLPSTLKQLERMCGDAPTFERGWIYPIGLKSTEIGLVIYHWGIDCRDDDGNIDGTGPTDWGIRIAK